MAMDPRLWAIIRRYAPRYGLDPRAVAAISMNESGGRFGAVGDNGTSFGPWQLHVGGALPAGRGAAWANSLAGIQYALRSMASSGARGLRGQAAVSAIARNFERPANPGAEISTALRYYNSPGFARGSAAAGMGGGGGAGGRGAAARGNPGAALALLGAIQPVGVGTPLRQTPSALDTINQFIAARAPQQQPLGPQINTPQFGETADALSGQLGAIHSRLLSASGI